MNRAHAFTVLRAAQEARRVPGGEGPIAVAGAAELVPLLARELRTGGDGSAVIENGTPARASVLVWIGKPDENALRAASRAGVPIVGLTDGESLPYVLDTNLVRVAPGQSFPIESIAAAVARVLGPGGASLAARLPVLRPAVVRGLVQSAARRNGLIGAATFVPGADLPAMTLTEVRLATRIAVASGRNGGSTPELLGVIGAGLALRRLSRELDRAPVWSILVRGGIAFGGTFAIGEVLRRRFA